jgi:hypothetical protein
VESLLEKRDNVEKVELPASYSTGCYVIRKALKLAAMVSNEMTLSGSGYNKGRLSVTSP